MDVISNPCPENDPILLDLKSKLRPELELISASLITKKYYQYNEPRIILELKVKEKSTGNEEVFGYSYNQLKRKMK